MLDLAMRGTLILVFAFAAAGVMRRASAAARHLLWASALAGLLVLPAVVRLGPAVHVPVPVLASTTTIAPDPEPAALAEPAPAAEPEVTVVRTRTHTRVRSHEHVHRTTTPVAAPVYAAPSATAYIVAPDRVERRVGIGQRAWDARWAIWAAGLLLVLGRLLLGMARVRSIVREAVPVTDPEWLSLLERVAHPLGVYRRVTLRVGPAGAVPVTCGILAPVIILPEDAEDWDDERRALVLTHELAHVRRLDVLTHIIGQCAVALFWFHPLAWLAAARMRLERERACDDLVLGSGARPSRYAGDLLDLVQTLNGPTAPAAAALAMARRTEIEGRLLSILDAAVRRGPLSPRRIAGALVVAAFGIVTIAAVRPVATPPAYPAPHRTVVVRVAGGGWTNNYVALADIAEAAATIASDAAKRQVLFEIGQRYGASDTLRHAFFGAINTMASSTERRRVLLALVGRGDRDEQTLIEVVRSAGKMASDHDKGGVLRTVAGLDQLTDPALRHEFFAAVGTMASSSERTRVLLAVLGEARARGRANPAQNAMIARLALNAATALPSSSDKVRVLRAVVHGGWLSDAAVSHDFNICLTTLGGGVDYHYVVSGGGD